MTTHIDFVPKWVRISVGVLALLNILFGIMGYFDMSILFHNGAGLDLTNGILKQASNECSKEFSDWFGFVNCSLKRRS